MLKRRPPPAPHLCSACLWIDPPSASRCHFSGVCSGSRCGPTWLLMLPNRLGGLWCSCESLLTNWKDKKKSRKLSESRCMRLLSVSDEDILHYVVKLESCTFFFPFRCSSFPVLYRSHSSILDLSATFLFRPNCFLSCESHVEWVRSQSCKKRKEKEAVKSHQVCFTNRQSAGGRCSWLLYCAGVYFAELWLNMESLKQNQAFSPHWDLLHQRVVQRAV